MILSALAFFGRQGRWVLPIGLVAGVLLPSAAEPLRQAIPVCIGVLLFLAVLRLFPDTVSLSASLSARQWFNTGKVVLLAQVALPILVYTVGVLLGIPPLYLMAATLVAAAPPISGSPNLVALLHGDGANAMRWLMLGTAVLPLSCLPVLFLLFPAQAVTTMLQPSFVLLSLIMVSVLLAVLVLWFSRQRGVVLPAQALDGASAILLAVMVVGLMSAVHEPDTRPEDIALMLLFAIALNAGLQSVGVLIGRALKLDKARTIAQGVILGNRNIALYLTALPALQMEPLLLFIACYQVPMYLTPLIGDLFYRRLE